jgi:ubiquitin-protein ligase
MAGLTAVASRRIQSELTEWTRNPPEGMMLESCEPDVTCWIIRMAGPEDAPTPLYRGETFRLRVRFGDRYPLEPPEVIFVPPDVPVHCHCYSNGHIW